MKLTMMTLRWVCFSLSALVIGAGLISIALYGWRLGIDFTGGSLIEVNFADSVVPGQTEVIETLQDTYEVATFQTSGAQSAIMRGPLIDNDKKEKVVAALMQKWPKVTVSRFEAVGPILGRELLQKTLLAAALAALFITVYIWRQFQNITYGVSAVLAMLHDTLVLLGTFSILGHWFGVEVDVLFVTAVMTTLSFSIHDTIVVYDRIREMRRQHPRASFAAIVDAAVLQTLSRSINNSFTIIVMLLSLFLLGGDTIHWFALALLVGAITGTYSSTFTAVPLLLTWEDFKIRRRQHKQQALHAS